MIISFRLFKILFVRRGGIILLCSFLFLFFYLIPGKKYPAKKNRPFEIKYNLMEETKNAERYVKDCTVEYANTHRLQQDHPCVLELIRKYYSTEPISRNVPYALHQMNQKDPSAGQTKAIMRLLRHKTNGFFIECGASDGEYLSNTLYMERFKNWTGLLIEPDPKSYQYLLDRKRKAWHIPACLSLEMYPTQVTFKTQFQDSSILEKASWFDNDETTTTTVQCFPLYSILMAHERKVVDFFSLDVEGHELKILKTVPWHKIDVRTIAVEWEHVEEGPQAIIDFMEDNGFVNFGHIATPYARDIVFVKDFLRDLRYDYDDVVEDSFGVDGFN